MNRTPIGMDEVNDPHKLRVRLDLIDQRQWDILARLDEIRGMAGTAAGSGLTPAERQLLQQLSVGSTSNAAPAQPALVPAVTSLPPVATATDGQVVLLTTDGRQYRFDGSTHTWVPNSAGTHNLLSATHPDTLAASPIRGDLVVANATPAWARFAKSTAFKVLRMNAGATDPEWGGVDDSVLSANVVKLSAFGQMTIATQFGAEVYANVTQSIPNNALTSVNFTTALSNVGGGWVIGTPSRYTIPTGGTGNWLFIGQVGFAANAVGRREALLLGSGAVNLARHQVDPDLGGAATFLQVVWFGQGLAPTNYVELQALQNSGGALNTDATDAGATKLMAIKLS